MRLEERPRGSGNSIFRRRGKLEREIDGKVMKKKGGTGIRKRDQTNPPR